MRWGTLWAARQQFFDGFVVTVEVSLASLVFSMAIAVVIVLAFQSKSRPLRLLMRAYTEFMQNVPPIIHVLFIFYGVSAIGLRLSAIESGILGLSLYSSAFMAEAIRSGINAVDRGQWDAARASGLPYVRVMRLVIFPQAVVYALPPLTNQWIRLIKNTSILAVIAGGDLMYNALTVASETFAVFEVFSGVWIGYLLITVPVSRLALAVENNIKWRPRY